MGRLRIGDSISEMGLKLDGPLLFSAGRKVGRRLGFSSSLAFVPFSKLGLDVGKDTDELNPD